MQTAMSNQLRHPRTSELQWVWTDNTASEVHVDLHASQNHTPFSWVLVFERSTSLLVAPLWRVLEQTTEVETLAETSKHSLAALSVRKAGEWKTLWKVRITHGASACLWWPAIIRCLFWCSFSEGDEEIMQQENRHNSVGIFGWENSSWPTIALAGPISQ